MINNIKKQNDQYHFLPEFLRKNGLPVWDKVVANVPITGNYHSKEQTTIGAKINDTSSIQVFFIPLRSADSSVKTYIACVKDAGKYKYDV